MVHVSKKYWLIILTLLIGAYALGQKKGGPEPDSIATRGLHAGIKVFAKAYGDSVVLRWAPDDKWAWTSLNYSGYVIERIDATDSVFTSTILTPQPLKPMTLEEMKTAFAGSDDKYAAMAAQCLYGKNFTFNTRQEGAGGIKDKSDVWNSRYAFALEAADFDAPTATATALRFTDRNVRKKGVYIYRVYPATPTHQGRIDTGAVAVINLMARKVKPKLHEAIAGDKVAELHWMRRQSEQYSAYYIERSSDGKVFRQINKVPFISSLPDTALFYKADSLHRQVFSMMRAQQAYIDSLPEDNHRYYYRIRGVNAFAEWSDYSDTLSVTGIDLTAPTVPLVDKPKYMSARTISLHWTKKIKEPDFKGYMILRAHNRPTEKYFTLTTALLDTSATTFTDTAAFEHGATFYRVVAVDTAGNIGYSTVAMGMVPDTTPPAPPTGLQGRIDRDGRVYLHWNRNTEEDVKGYKVYFANSSEHVYAQITITPGADTTFTDIITLNTLTKNIWYKVVAVDQNNNHSGYSAPVVLKRPDIVAPVAPLVASVLVDTGGVRITWIKSASSDAVSYTVFRKQEQDSIWTPVFRVKHDSTQATFFYIDNSVSPFVTYNYCAETVDEDSLHSGKSAPATATVKTIAPLPPLQTLSAVYDGSAQAVHLKWSYQGSGQYYFVLYKAVGNGSLMKFHTLGADQDHFTDGAASSGDARYAIQVVFTDQSRRTRVSEPVAVGR